MEQSSEASRAPRATTQYNVKNLFFKDLQKPPGPIRTGIGYLDHMIDQFNSHAQIGIAFTIDCADKEVLETSDDHNRFACHDQDELLRFVGATMGTEIKRLLLVPAVGTSSTFCCPLDEALVRCVISTGQGNLSKFSLEPYGIYPPSGRKSIGSLHTKSLQGFWNSLAIHANIDLRLEKIRGTNAHHIVEASFKAFCRALRNLLDNVDAQAGQSLPPLLQLYGPSSANAQLSRSLDRQGNIDRKTKETAISVTLRLDGGDSGVQVDTGLTVLDEFLITLAKSAQMSLQLVCHGDTWIDEHHTAEDVAIALGQCIDQALGVKAGLNRMWCAHGSCGGETSVQVVMDLSNRPYFTHNLPLARGNIDSVGDLPVEMFEHVLDSLVVNARMTVHVLDKSNSKMVDIRDMIEATAQALGKAFLYCAAVDGRRAGATASSKGTLSV